MMIYELFSYCIINSVYKPCLNIISHPNKQEEAALGVGLVFLERLNCFKVRKDYALSINNLNYFLS